MTQPIHPLQPAPMGIPLDELIERAVKHARYETLAEVVKTLDERTEKALSESYMSHPDEVMFDRSDFAAMIKDVASECGVPAPAALKD